MKRLRCGLADVGGASVSRRPLRHGQGRGATDAAPPSPPPDDDTGGRPRRPWSRLRRHRPSGPASGHLPASAFTRDSFCSSRSGPSTCTRAGVPSGGGAGATFGGWGTSLETSVGKSLRPGLIVGGRWQLVAVVDPNESYLGDDVRGGRDRPVPRRDRGLRRLLPQPAPRVSLRGNGRPAWPPRTSTRNTERTRRAGGRRFRRISATRSSSPAAGPSARWLGLSAYRYSTTRSGRLVCLRRPPADLGPGVLLRLSPRPHGWA